MNLFKSMYEAKKREIEMKQGKHGLLPKYVMLGFLYFVYFYRAFFLPYGKPLRPFILVVGLILIVSLVRDLKAKKLPKTPTNKNI